MKNALIHIVVSTFSQTISYIYTGEGVSNLIWKTVRCEKECVVLEMHVKRDYALMSR